MSERRKNTLLLLSTFVVLSVSCEIAFRAVNGVSLADNSNFRNTNVIRINLSDASQYDESLGWTHKNDLRYSNFSTTEYGIRRTSSSQPGPRPGNVLVVGSSFAAGSQVADEESFPAQLEQLLDRPVDNAGIGGYGMDQIILRAEQLLPLLKPEILVIELMDSSLSWVSYSHLPRPKPYFTIGSSGLVAHHQPVPYQVTRDDPFDGIKSIAGYSLIIDRIMATVNSPAWYGTGVKDNIRIQNDPVEITCALLRRLKPKLDQSKTRPLLVTSTGAQDVAIAGAPPKHVLMVEECARDMGYQQLSVFDTFRNVYVSDPKGFDSLFVITNGVRGHMSKDGNAVVAKQIAAALKEPPPAASPQVNSAVKFIPGDGQNLVAGSEALETFFLNQPHARLQRPGVTLWGPKVFGAAATGPKGEHYLTSQSLAIAAGPFTLSMEVKPEKFGLLRLQALDSSSTGIFGDFDLKRRLSSTSRTRTGTVQQMRAGIEPLWGGWYRVWMAATVAAADFRILVQFTDANGQFDFVPSGEALLLRALQIEKGQSYSPYQPTAQGNRQG